MDNLFENENNMSQPEEPVSENIPAPAEDISNTPDSIYNSEQPRSAAEPVSTPVYEQETKSPYYEPWREPVYREPEARSGVYTPNYSGEHYPNSNKTKDYEPRRSEKSSFGKFVRAVCLILVCALAGGLSAYSVIEYRMDELDNTNKTVVIGASSDTAQNTDDLPNASISYGSMSAEAIYDLACTQTVGIRTTLSVTNIWGQTTSQPVSGTGFVISEDGYIITNFHVIESYLTYNDRYDTSLHVIFHDGSEYSATVVGYESSNDIAVLKVDASGLTPITIGSSSEMDVGETVYTVGNPLGELTYTMTFGIVSALDRTIATDATTTINVFQFDAAVNSGNSGGPVYNADGEVIGVVTAKYSETGIEGLGFAIPIDDAISIATSLIENGYVTGKAYLGGQFADVKESVVEYYKLPYGIVVVEINQGSPADNAGLMEGDIITALDDIDIVSTSELKNTLAAYSPGDEITLTVYRSGSYITIPVTLGESSPGVA